MSARRADPAEWGVATEYEDAGGEIRRVPEATVDWIPDEMAATEGGPPHEGAPLVLRPGGHLPAGRWRLLAEDGGEAAVAGALPPDAPLGYHRLVGEDGAERRLIVSPGRCVLPERAWGWAAQLYSLRSARSWGMGDLADLRRLAGWCGSRGAGALLLNPLHADMPERPAQPSPYSPSSRLYRNPVYLEVAGVAEACGSSAGLADLERAGRALNDGPRIDRDAVMAFKAEALERIWRGFRGHDDLEAYRAREGDLLRRFATFCALAEHHRRPWEEWPPEHRRPDSPGVRAFAAGHADRVAHQEWLQPNEEGTAAIRERLASLGGLADDAPVEEAVEAAYRLLGESPSLVRVAALEDAALVAERPNVPGTVDERPNWSIPLPVSLEQLERAPMAERIGRLLSGQQTRTDPGLQAGGVASRQ